MASGNCAIEGCEKPRYYAKEWCVMHYRRWQRNGDPEARQVYRGDPAGSLKANSRQEGSCRVWTGFLTHDGYGLMKTRGVMRPAHAVAWELENGVIPPGMVIDHKCWNRACVNVEHLRLATLSENQWNRGKWSSATGHRNVYQTREGRYYVQIRYRGEKISFGTYSDLSEAAEVARRGREELFGRFAGRG